MSFGFLIDGIKMISDFNAISKYKLKWYAAKRALFRSGINCLPIAGNDTDSIAKNGLAF